DEQSAILRERAGHADHLALRDGEVAHRFGGVERVGLAETLEELAGFAAHGGAVEKESAELSRFAADENVVEGAEVRKSERFLVDHGDAGGFAGADVAQV